jgi:predicted RNase H-like HicB family nuclease
MDSNRYPFIIEWSEEDHEYVATCPAFPGLSAFGETEEEALREGKIALAGFIETCEANNMSLPEPAIRGAFSGKLQLRLPKSLHRLASQMANSEDVSLNTYIMDAIRARVSAEQFGGRVLNELRTAVASVLTVRPQTTQYTKTTESFEQTVITSTAERRREH